MVEKSERMEVDFLEIGRLKYKMYRHCLFVPIFNLDKSQNGQSAIVGSLI